ncbi:MAG: hypothetical protein ABSH56_32955 [Bryobacteraceae bacterium]|jgi:hypothetical protein
MEKPIRNPACLQRVRSLPCLVCRTTRAVEAAHTGPHGLSQKSSDLSAIPLCGKHHRELGSTEAGLARAIGRMSQLRRETAKAA